MFFIGIFGIFGLPILSVLGWQSEADCGFVVELIVGYDGKFLREYNTFTVLCVWYSSQRWQASLAMNIKNFISHKIST